ncbi:MAG TPA: alcohol dehydrogenase catalytic domain-containing protein [Clostridiaceae bacterium]|nr:alcohol dehydrogenase catalytic domain-containing protein [Clostridiaceae bacterium]
MKSLRLNQDNELYFIDMPKPQIVEPNQVLIKMAYASICGYDMMTIKGQAGYPKDGQMGHEGSGLVVAVGSNVHESELKVGDHVSILPFQFCGHCKACRSKQTEYCLNPSGRSDLMTEYIVEDKKFVFRLPPHLSLKEGCLIEPLMMGMYAVKKANLKYDSRVLILGCGAMGQIILKLVKMHPVSRVVVVEPDFDKRRKALEFGADVALDVKKGTSTMSAVLNDNDGLGYDAVLEVSGDRNSAEMALNVVARGGSVVYYGLYGMEYALKVNLFNLYWKDTTITAVCVPSGYFPPAIDFAHRIGLEDVISAIFPFRKAIEAFEEKATGRHAKVMIEF